MWFLYSTPSRGADKRGRNQPDPGVERQQALERERQLAQRPDPEPPKKAVFEPAPSRKVVQLDDRPQIHLGRRGDRRSAHRLDRQEREHGVLQLLAQFRTASRKSVVDSCFDGHPFAANRTLTALQERGLVERAKVPRGRTGYFVYHLSFLQKP